MKIGTRKPSLNKVIGGYKGSMTRKVKSGIPFYGSGLYTKPKKRIYNKVYNKSTFSIWSLFK